MTRPRMRYRPPRASQRPLLPAEGPPRRGVFAAVEGPIGVGKTTLSRLLADALEAAVVLEVVEDNPFLHHFYQDIRGFAFQTQIFFFLSRYRQQEGIKEARDRRRSVVSDYIFAKDRLFARMNLDARELDLYDRLFALIAPMTVRPDVVIYLTATLETLMRRIAHRDRPFERAIEEGYMERLIGEYEEFFGTYEETALLRVDTDAVDIFTENDLGEILRYVEQAQK